MQTVMSDREMEMFSPIPLRHGSVDDNYISEQSSMTFTPNIAGKSRDKRLLRKRFAGFHFAFVATLMPAVDDKRRTMLFYGWSKFRCQHVRIRLCSSSRSASHSN